jgi:hypothetical protein
MWPRYEHGFVLVLSWNFGVTFLLKHEKVVIAFTTIKSGVQFISLNYCGTLKVK